jgi:hypothetical protein
MYQPSRSRRATKARAGDGAELRHVVVHDYHDHAFDRPASVQAEDMDNKKRSGPRGGVNVPFPTKLHVMLSRVEADGLTHIVGWQPHGRCFVIHKPREFVDQIMPEYFRQSKLTSFQRQLNLYGFRRLTTGADRGGYYHEMFLKHKLFLCRTMTRIRIKGTGIKGKASPETEPNFYHMPEIKPECDYLLNQRIESEVLSALEEEEDGIATSPRTKKEAVEVSTQEPTRRSKRNGTSKPPKYSSVGSESPSFIETKTFLPPLVTPEECAKAPVSFRKPSERNRRSIYSDSANNKNAFMNLAPPLLPRSLSNHSLMSNSEYHSDDRISFEGQHFHYLDSFSVHEVTKAPEPARPFGMPPSRYSSAISLPQLTATISDEDLSYNMCNTGVVSSSSSADTRYIGTAQYPTENITFTPSNIFSKEGDRGSWSIDIDREFLLMED